MSIRNLFDGKTPYKLFSETPEGVRDDAESFGNVNQTLIEKETFIPQVDFSDPANFVKYGSAESYYSDAITRIYEDYPYDGSSKEKKEYLNQSTYLDLWILENKYPRTNGFVTISAEGWGSTAPGGNPNSSNDFYGNPVSHEYINFVGGPHTASQGMIGKPLSETFGGSNVYDEDIYDNAGFTGSGTRESNLKTNFDNGVTIEFWLKKEGYDINRTQKEVVFDLWNNITGSSSDYGRVTLQVNTFNLLTSAPAFQLTVRSGSTGPIEQEFGSSVTTTTIADFHHYAFRIYNSGSNLRTDFYVDGALTDQSSSSPNLGEITGSLAANIGSLIASTSDGVDEHAGLGWGKLSGSLDEFRFWKSKRTSEEIGRYWFDQTYGGTNTDISNADLGIYFKFNEGITGNTTLDSTILDYSGRVTNGLWTGYNTSARNTGSAMVISNAAPFEFRDPIIYSEHPDVQSLITELQQSGSNYDVNNFTSLYNTFPNWIVEEDQQTGDDLKRLSQIMSSFFDTLYLQIQEINKIKDVSYISEDKKQLPFADALLRNYGFVAPEIFADASLLDQIFDRSEGVLFEEGLEELKNTIYKNIYNNIVSIYKSKGTSNAFRNLIRCYGVDEKLIKINAYANNLTYDLRENKNYSSTKKNFIDFYNPDNFSATIYQQTSSVPISTSFISASGGTQEDYTSFTLESEVILPKRRKRSDYDYFATPFETSSIMGFHSADPTAPQDFTWPANDYDLQVYAVSPSTNGNQKSGYFLVTSSYYGTELTSSVIENLYDNKKWNISLVVKPSKHNADLVSGSSDTDYDVKFYAVNAYSDIIQEEVELQGVITTDGEKLLNTSKRIYAGAHRNNFTGSVVHRSDIKLSSLRYWASELDDSVIRLHAENSDSFGPEHPLRNTHNFVTSIQNVEIPQLQTLALHWRFDQVTGSDAGSGSPTVADAGFTVTDFSSGSTELQQRYSWMGNVLGTPHSGRGDFFYPNETKVVNVEFVPTAVQQNPEVVSANNTVNIYSTQDEQLFTRQTRPTTFTFVVEKSMYAAITSEILNYFATILDFNNLIGDPVNRYRQEYKSLGKLRQLFFEKVQNEPDVERYIEYYKWVDDSLGDMLMNLFPASADKQDGIRNMIESHVLERNKYWNKYPTVDLKQEDPETGIRGINELTYSWEDGHRPISGNENEACFWWNQRAERDKAPLATGDAGVDSDKEAILSATLSVLNRSYSTPYKYSVKKEKTIGSGVEKDNNIRQNVKKSVKFGLTDGILIPNNSLDSTPNCTDGLTPVSKVTIPYKMQNQLDSDPYMTGQGDFLAPFTSVMTQDFLVSGKFINTGYNKKINEEFQPGFGIENLHIDSYIDSNVPAQGPFTEKYVGGNQHRHIKLNDGTDNQNTRPEAWSMEFQGLFLDMKIVHQPVNRPRAMLFRGLTAKSPLNIENIKTNTDTHGIGNYRDEYEIVQTTGRTTNNSAFVKAGGFAPESVPSPYVAGMDDYAKPQRGRSSHVFVNRFSSPGDPNTMGDSNGGPGLDVEAAEYSSYNDLNYRNFAVREPLTWLYASHVNQFGFYSDTFGKGSGPSEVNSLNYNGTGSVYQVNRNTIRQMKDSGSTTVTASVYDNFFVQHPIPRTDRQYAWITSSAVSYDAFGYLPYDGEGDLVTFSTASDFVSYVRTIPSLLEAKFGKDSKQLSSTMLLTEIPIYTAYNWMNINTNSPIEYENAFIGYSPSSVDISSSLNGAYIKGGLQGAGKASLLNAILLKRNGPYQHPSWKQTRGNQNPLVRKWNSSNLTAYNLNNGSFKLKDDSPVISRYKPLQTNLTFAIEGSKEKNLRFTTTYGNDITLFSNEEINNDLNIDDQNNNYRDNSSPYAKVRELYVAGSLQDENNLVQGIKYFSYGEQIYPAAINMYSRRNRERIGYKNTFWRDSRTARSELGLEKFGGTNSQGFAISQSAWAIDTSEQFGTSVSTFVAHNAASGAAGELQNDYTFAWSFVGQSTGDVNDLEPSPIYSRKHMMGACLSAVDPFATFPWYGNGRFDISPPTAYGYLISTRLATSNTYLENEELPATTSWPGGLYNGLGHVSIFGGNAEFQAHEQAGYVDEGGNFISSPSKPFYDKYDLYNQIMRVKNKDMSIIPEFRISDNIEKYLNGSDGFLTRNTASYSIFGVNENNTEVVSYTDDDGATETYSVQTSKDTPQNSGEGDFYKIYSNSDFMKYFEIISDDHDDFEDFPKTLTLKCSALKKFIAYDGFYPAERTLEIAKNFSDVYKTEIQGVASATSSAPDNLKMRPILAPLFSPGILYNTIKSGIAVDYPIYTSSYEVVRYEDNASGSTDYYAIGAANNDLGRWHHRVQFEDILNPSRLTDVTFVDMEPHPSASLSSTFNASRISEGVDPSNNYTFSIDNFLASTVDFFLEDSELTSLASLQQSKFKSVTSGSSYAMRIKMRRSARGQKREDSIWATPQEYFSSASANSWKIKDPGGANISVTFTEQDYRMFTLNMYTRPTAFGPPMAGSGSYEIADNGQNFGYTALWLSSAGGLTSPLIKPRHWIYDGLYGFNVSHTPPYYNGEAWVDIIYNPSVSGQPTIDDIEANSEIVCWRIDGRDPDTWPSGDTDTYPMHRDNVNNYAMQLTSSINIFNKLFVKSAEKPDENNPSWAIQTKFETPVLNFGSFGKANYSNPGAGGEEIDFQSTKIFENVTTPFQDSEPWSGSCGTTTTPMGMWHQFGTIPDEEENQGIFLEVTDIPSEWLNTRAAEGDISERYNSGALFPLANIVGFNKVTNSKKIGRLATSKRVFEAVVAIPFYFESDDSIISKKDKINPDRNYFKLSSTKGDIENELEEMRAFAKNIEDMDPKSIFGEDQASLISTSFKIRDKYVFPPDFDYFRNQASAPVAMYIFEFDHIFDKDDLSYIWQNIAPKFGTNKETPEYFEDIEDDAKMVASTVSHPLFTEGKEQLDDLQGPNGEPVQWIVFKVKQRAKTSYNKLLIPNKDEKTPVSENQFSYNWPYDYFSMIEFAKIDSKISYGLTEVETGIAAKRGNYATGSITGLPPVLNSDLEQTNSTSTSELKTKAQLINVEVSAQKQKNSKKIK